MIAPSRSFSTNVFTSAGFPSELGQLSICMESLKHQKRKRFHTNSKSLFSLHGTVYLYGVSVFSGAVSLLIMSVRPFAYYMRAIGSRSLCFGLTFVELFYQRGELQI
jgi:hypothetical protein